MRILTYRERKLLTPEEIEKHDIAYSEYENGQLLIVIQEKEQKKREREQFRQYRKMNPRKIRGDKGRKRNEYNTTLPSEYRSCLNRANSKGLPFEYNLEEFYDKVDQDCYYCGHEASGLDRVDNTLGYTKDNTVPCCAQCNIMKNVYTQEQFLNKIKDIHNHLML